MRRQISVDASSPPVKHSAKSHITVVLAESFPMLLAGMDQTLSAHSDVRVVARCADGTHALTAVREHQPDVLVTDLRLANGDGLATLKSIMQERLPTRVILLTEHIDEHELLDAMRLGAKGVVLKQMPAALLVRCIRKVHAGGTWIENESMAMAVGGLLRRDLGSREMRRVLTPREVEILRAVAGGERNTDVARALGITVGTVKIHLHNIYEKLKLSSRLELILYARERGWL
jgi:DNA-binding NarL/FixJ family response regulator